MCKNLISFARFNNLGGAAFLFASLSRGLLGPIVGNLHGLGVEASGPCLLSWNHEAIEIEQTNNLKLFEYKNVTVTYIYK